MSTWYLTNKIQALAEINPKFLIYFDFKTFYFLVLVLFIFNLNGISFRFGNLPNLFYYLLTFISPLKYKFITAWVIYHETSKKLPAEQLGTWRKWLRTTS